MDQESRGSNVLLDDLDHTEHAHEFVVESGQATFRIGDETVVVDGGHVVVSPPGEAPGFTNTGTGELRLTAIHGASRFNTEWLAGDDPAWTSKPVEQARPEAPA